VGLDHHHDRQLGHGLAAQGRRLTVLPPPREPGHYSIAVVCLGNICRSPTAHVVLEARLAEAGLDDRVVVHSSGTGDWHVGEPMDRRAASALTAGGYDPSRHRARQYDDSWTSTHDLVLAMDADNLADLGGRSLRVAMFRDFDPVEPGADVPDPYYGGADGFALVLEMIERTSDALVAELAELR
jgi:protein-tyrosine phosphatase